MSTAGTTTRRTYTQDLGKRVLYQHLVLERKPQEISRDLDMSLRVVQRILKLWKEIGDVMRNPEDYKMRRKGPRVNEVTCNYMLKLLDDKPDLHLDEIAIDLSETLGVSVSLSTIHRSLHLLGHTRKKLSKVALERCEAARLTFLFNIGDESPQRLVFTDESAVNILTTYRSMDREPKGGAEMKTYFQRGARYSVLPAMSMRGIIYHHITPGSFNGDTFKQYIVGLLKVMNPYPQEQSVLVMDNCAMHHVEGISELCDQRGVKLAYLSPFSPDFNPINECFSYMQEVIRGRGVQFRAAVETKDEAAITGFISDVLATVTSDHARGWFRHSNYL